MDEHYLYSTVRYVERNPVIAKLCESPEQWRWSSAGAHLQNKDDRLVTVKPMLERITNWQVYLSEINDDVHIAQMKQHLRTGRLLGNEEFMDRLEKLFGRTLRQKNQIRSLLINKYTVPRILNFISGSLFAGPVGIIFAVVMIVIVAFLTNFITNLITQAAIWNCRNR